MCAACTGVGKLCPSCREREFARLPTGSARARGAQLGFIAGIGLLLVYTLSLLATELRVFDDEATVLRLATVSAESLLNYRIVQTCSALLFLSWWYSMVARAKARNVKVTHGPGDSVAYWFVPIVNLFYPYQTMREITTGLGVSPPRKTWWTAWVGFNILSIVQRYLLTQAADRASPQVVASSVLWSVLGIVTLVLFIRVITVIQDALNRPAPVTPPVGQTATPSAEKGTPA